MSSESPEVHGRCEPAFESLRQALAEIMDAGSEVGTALAVHVGEPFHARIPLLVERAAGGAWAMYDR